MLIFSIQETLWMVLAAIVLDFLIGDPNWRWYTHPVIWIGRAVGALEKRLLHRDRDSAVGRRRRGLLLALVTVTAAFGVIWFAVGVASAVHPYFGYAANVWFISTTIAVKGLREAAVAVYTPLREERLMDARKYVGYIVGRDTTQLDEPEITRAAVETVAENIVDAVISPICYALLGGAPLAMLYRASNTLDSMVGYKNEKYIDFGWASARWDDVLNWIPARVTGLLLVFAASVTPALSASRSFGAIRRFAGLHPSPNSGIPESAVAGALGIELGGVNVYHGRVSERARMGWPLREREREDIMRTVRLMYTVSFTVAGGLLLCALLSL
ncbi:adenosylcobinamide-phosphate synthase CbiB [Paenibacillus allorhizosphaerae]|uniref:Cobalamin biosynthesis protein CobD n=1 Tax=Paenibacillus allorhizosphaerae TaxID=2849866 RepID=A0ABN7TMX0_9BACL|nr:adenosylcobinamide-phosphate synthase CbiB [Paenibacillus allorhizosphaerae]CAG7633238.1 Cobalamin biosynthesis protein CobD [Paenibacillus allorhizosphaerae]